MCKTMVGAHCVQDKGNQGNEQKLICLGIGSDVSVSNTVSPNPPPKKTKNALPRLDFWMN